MKSFILIALGCCLAGCSTETVPDDCSNCHSVVGLVQENFHNASREHAYHNFQQLCGKLDKLANGCGSINSTVFDELYEYLEKSFRPNDFCFNAGECSSNLIVPAVQTLRSIPTGEQDAPECELCKELVKHVVTNLTEDHSREVLLNACKEMGSFQFDCIHITEEYYSLLHDYLIDKLNLKAVCSFFGVCSGPGFFGARLPIPSVIDLKKPVINPVPKPVPVPIPVTPKVVAATSKPYVSSNWGSGYGYNSRPLFNFNPDPAYALAPLAAAAPVFAVLPLFAVG